MIQIELNRMDGDFHLLATNEQGNEVHLDASPDIGGTGQGMRPMQILLASLAGCSTIDVINILKKQRQRITNIKTLIKGDRDERVEPSVFKYIQVHFILSGEIDPKKAGKAVKLAVEKYCSVAAMLNKVKISHSYEIIKREQ